MFPSSNVGRNKPPDMSLTQPRLFVLLAEAELFPTSLSFLFASCPACFCSHWHQWEGTSGLLQWASRTHPKQHSSAPKGTDRPNGCNVSPENNFISLILEEFNFFLNHLYLFCMFCCQSCGICCQSFSSSCLCFSGIYHYLPFFVGSAP